MEKSDFQEGEGWLLLMREKKIVDALYWLKDASEIPWQGMLCTALGADLESKQKNPLFSEPSVLTLQADS